MSSSAVNEHRDVVHDTQFDYYGKLLATASSDRSVGIFLVQDQVPIKKLTSLAGHEGPVWAVSWAHPRFGSLIASASYDQRAVLWKETPVGSQKWRPVHVISVHEGSVNDVQWAPQEFGPLVATASSDGTVATTQCCDGSWQQSVKISNNANSIAHAMGATCVSFAPYNVSFPQTVILASGGCDRQIRLWRSEKTGNEFTPFGLLRAVGGFSEWIHDVAFMPSSSSRFIVIAACTADKCVVIMRKPWRHLLSDDAGEEWERSTIVFEEAAWRLTWSTCGNMLIVTTSSSEVFVLSQGTDFCEPWIRTPLKDYIQ